MRECGGFGANGTFKEHVEGQDVGMPVTGRLVFGWYSVVCHRGPSNWRSGYCWWDYMHAWKVLEGRGELH